MTGRNALLSTELIKLIELMRSVDLDFAGHRKGQGWIPGQALFLSTFQPLRLFILLWISCSLSFLEISIHILVVSKTDTGLFIDPWKVPELEGNRPFALNSHVTSFYANEIYMILPSQND